MAKDLEPLEALDVLASIGWIAGVDAGGELGTADPDPENEPDRPLGVDVRRNPFAMIRDDPELWAIWDEWRLGYRLKPIAREYTALSAFHVEALRELRCARNRAMSRRLKQLAPAGSS